jgi:hypothetical protein
LRAASRRRHPTGCEQATDSNQKCETRIHHANCGGGAVMDKRKYAGRRVACARWPNGRQETT